MSFELLLQQHLRGESGEGATPAFEDLIGLAAAEGHFPLLLERLSQARRWAELGVAARAALVQDPGVQAARAYLRSGEEGAAPELTRDELLSLVDCLPEDARALWLLGGRLVAEGGAEADEGRRLSARALQICVRAGIYDDLEEGFVRLLDASEPGPLRTGLAIALAAAKGGKVAEASSFFELALPKFVEMGLASEAWSTARRILEKLPDGKSFRPAAAAALRAHLRGSLSGEAIVAESGLEKGVALSVALSRLDLLLRFLPGSFVEHAGWGVGRVEECDLEWVTVIFSTAGEKRMRHDIATRSLTVLEPDDLRVLLALERARVRAMAAEDPSGLLVLALRRLNGEGSGADIRRVLEGSVIAAKDWAAWWKTAREKARTDARVDTGQAFRQIFRLAEPGSAEAAVPRIEEGGAPAQSVTLLRRFIEHNPESAAAVRARYLSELERWLRGPRSGAMDRGAVLLLLTEWEPDRAEELKPAILKAFGDGLDVSALTTLGEQQKALEIGAGLGAAEHEALLSTALGSRHAEVRDAAFDAILSIGGDAKRLVQELLAAADQKPAVLFVLAAHLLASKDAELPYGVWDVVRSFTVLLQSRPSDVTAQRALRFFALDADLLERARSEPASSDTRSFLEVAVLEWRGSDRYLFPVVDFLSEAGFPDLPESLRSRRAQAGERLAARATAPEADAAPSGVWMTRASFEALRGEIREVGLALKTTIPEAIRKARELGDLRENAEYAAAKAKQSQYAHRLGDLESKARVVRIVEDQPVSDRSAGPGTEVDLAGEGGEARVYWILGEGDQRHGESVVSCQAPLGRVLMGKGVGDTVDLGDGSGRFTITSIRIRLPSPAPQGRD